MDASFEQVQFIYFELEIMSVVSFDSSYDSSCVSRISFDSLPLDFGVDEERYETDAQYQQAVDLLALHGDVCQTKYESDDAYASAVQIVSGVGSSISSTNSRYTVGDFDILPTEDLDVDEEKWRCDRKYRNAINYLESVTPGDIRESVFNSDKKYRDAVNFLVTSAFGAKVAEVADRLRKMDTEEIEYIVQRYKKM